MDQPKIQIRNLKKAFGSKVVLSNINLDINAGESFVVIGGSGTGKSVLIKCILGLLTPDAGQILIDGEDVTHVPAKKRQDMMKRFGMLFQGGALFDSLTVWRNIAFGLMNAQGVKADIARQIALEKLREVDLPETVANIYPAELSGGMQKRVALARAIAGKPEMIFFDEPTTGLDPIVSSTINQLIVRNVRHLGATALTITHDINSLRHIADRVGLLFKGEFIWVGSVAEMDQTDNPYVKQFIQGLPEGPFTSLQ
ncbi:ABC transporter ATP-binding protein [Candidatus Odyssella thessalonicensis]|uniref:ABC transporter ATP-binding protein n=1 Tax=Candidatus Odyssella thessalonicensis TaxID=84647 RepID=UPI000225ACB3|nr:ATP-binding cassette domain-containing protein [Candidatus Odyssella thessalonicensis]